MKLFELLKVLDTLETNSLTLDLEVSGVHNDTRKMLAGDLFVAISGTEADGHNYIPKALEIGASMIVSERPLGSEIPHVVVPDTRAALAKLQAKIAGYPAHEMLMTGVTGTKGKTTVTHIVKGLIEAVTGKKCGLIGTNSTLIGNKILTSTHTTPDAVSLNDTFREMVNENCEHCVMEVSSHALDQSRTLDIPFAVGGFTNLHREHLDYHKTMENYFAAKSRLFAQSKIAVINIDDEYGKRLFLEKCPEAITVSQKEPAALRATDINLLPDGIEFTLNAFGSVHQVYWSTPGEFSVYNVLISLGIGHALGLDISKMAEALRELPKVKGRMERVACSGDYFVYIDYAHTPDAIKAALETARKFSSGRLIALFGCGGDRDKGKRPLMGKAAEEFADLCIVTSDNPRTENPDEIIRDIVKGMNAEKSIIEPDRRLAIARALSEARKGDVVMLLGKGHETYQEVNDRRFPFDEREVVKSL